MGAGEGVAVAVAAVAVAPEASGEETSATPPAGALGVERAATEWALFECADWTAEAAEEAEAA